MVDEITHYCSASVFLSFIKSKQLWLTSLSQSNDHLEGRWLLGRWLDKFDRSNREQEVRRGAEHLLEDVLRENVALGTCFSEQSDLLSQWRGYARDGSGFSITFDRKGLEEFVSNSENDPKPSLSKIIYGQNDWTKINEMIRSLWEAFGEDAKKFSAGPNGTGSMSLELSPEKFALQRAAARNLFTAKDRAFEEEKEWRLMLFAPWQEIPNLEYRDSINGVSPFLKFEIPTEIVRYVTIGPTNRAPVGTIQAALKSNGFKAGLLRSQASYRN